MQSAGDRPNRQGGTAARAAFVGVPRIVRLGVPFPNGLVVRLWRLRLDRRQRFARNRQKASISPQATNSVPAIVKRLLAILLALGVASAAQGQGAPRPHPAVVRVISPEKGGVSYGSGALVAVNEKHGMVLTNWHVVRDARGTIMVVFPGGFRSAAKVLKTDRDWDLAALVIWRPPIGPIPLADNAPRPGEPLTIAGYGPGWYRAATGRCTQYVSPGSRLPFEMVEVATQARQGDSGGPILNAQGELAGVLFGSGAGRTAGSYSGRVEKFLKAIDPRFQQNPAEPAMIAQRPASRPALPEALAASEPGKGVPHPKSGGEPKTSTEHSGASPPFQTASKPKWQPGGLRRLPVPGAVGGEAIASPSVAEPHAVRPLSPVPRSSEEIAGLLPAVSAAVGEASDTMAPATAPVASIPPPPAAFGDRIKTILAAIGAFLLLLHALRLVGTLCE